MTRFTSHWQHRHDLLCWMARTLKIICFIHKQLIIIFYIQLLNSWKINQFLLISRLCHKQEFWNIKLVNHQTLSGKGKGRKKISTNNSSLLQNHDVLSFLTISRQFTLLAKPGVTTKWPQNVKITEHMMILKRWCLYWNLHQNHTKQSGG